MLPPSEPRWTRLVAGYAALGAFVTLVTVPLYLLAEAPYRPALVRVASGVMLGVALLRLRAIVRDAVDAQRASGIHPAGVPAFTEPVLDRSFRQLHSEIRASVASRGYFEHILWPRLLVLDHRLPGGSTEAALRKPAGRRWLGRGPRLRDLRRALETLERRP